MFIISDRFKTANLNFYVACIAQTLEVKKAWRTDLIGQKTIKPAGEAASAMPTQE
jgi:hypothetical protein